jgi:hypothetical protein
MSSTVTLSAKNSTGRKHKPLCILYSKIVTTEKITLSRETVEELQRPQAGDKAGPFLKRRLYRCNAPNIYLGISASWDSIEIVVQEKKRGGGGYGVVSVFDHRTRELQISRYRLKYFPDTLAMLQRVSRFSSGVLKAGEVSRKVKYRSITIFD